MKESWKDALNKVEKLADEVVGDLGLELVDVEFKTERGRPHVLVFIDKPGGIFLEDCEEVSRMLGDLMDIEDPIPTSYTLEVSSPGLERPLKKPADFEKYQGEKVKIKTYAKIEGRKNFAGVLTSFDGNHVTVKTKEQEDECVIPLEKIAKAHLWYE